MEAHCFAGGDLYRLSALRIPPLAKWHLDEVVLKIAGVKHWLWRAVDQTGVVLDVLVQPPDATSRLPSGYCASC